MRKPFRLGGIVSSVIRNLKKRKKGGLGGYLIVTIQGPTPAGRFDVLVNCRVGGRPGHGRHVK